jgi:uncharacterized protein YbjT (DUF2867 family)
VPISVEQFASAVEAFVLPPEFVGLLTYLFTEVLDGRNAHLTDGVRRALGREPRDFYSLRARGRLNRLLGWRMMSGILYGTAQTSVRPSSIAPRMLRRDLF